MNERIEVGGKHPGYQVFIDSHPHMWVDIVDSWLNLEDHFPANSIQKLFASHVIEHLTFPLQLEAMKVTLAILKPGGEVELDTPDFYDLAVRMVQAKISPHECQHTIFGGQEYDANTHRFVHTPRSMFKMMSIAGFVVKKIMPENGGIKAIAVKPEEGYSYHMESNVYVYKREVQ